MLELFPSIKFLSSKNHNVKIMIQQCIEHLFRLKKNEIKHNPVFLIKYKILTS